MLNYHKVWGTNTFLLDKEWHRWVRWHHRSQPGTKMLLTAELHPSRCCWTAITSGVTLVYVGKLRTRGRTQKNPCSHWHTHTSSKADEKEGKWRGAIPFLQRTAPRKGLCRALGQDPKTQQAQFSYSKSEKTVGFQMLDGGVLRVNNIWKVTLCQAQM